MPFSIMIPCEEIALTKDAASTPVGIDFERVKTFAQLLSMVNVVIASILVDNESV